MGLYPATCERAAFMAAWAHVGRGLSWGATAHTGDYMWASSAFGPCGLRRWLSACLSVVVVLGFERAVLHPLKLARPTISAREERHMRLLIDGSNLSLRFAASPNPTLYSPDGTAPPPVFGS